MNWKEELEALLVKFILDINTETINEEDEAKATAKAFLKRNTSKGWLLSNLPEKAPSVEQHFKDHAYFNKWLKELDEGKRETILYMLEEYGKYFSTSLLDIKQ